VYNTNPITQTCLLDPNQSGQPWIWSYGC
jgi:hypothetical protein